MMTNREIERCARELIERHGPTAAARAEARAGEAASAGDDAAQAEWQKVAARIRDLRAGTIPKSFC
ncbi:MAG TPA: hypothetical protein VMI52_00010 [Acetobacteraceae bacterium]|nr:hypothetical protein [Methylomirabilota bacterium]HTR15400.1 hypothetical protein [Acetobacteraceae bacterium]